MTVYDPFPDKDEEWHELFEECHKDEWREEYIDVHGNPNYHEKEDYDE